MIFGLVVLFTALLISGVAAWYSIVGLMAIFSGAALAIAIMGGVLEVGKLVTASWLYNYWKVVPKFLKIYLTSAVVGLMFITSMGIFGFLSKAHLEQTAMSEEQIAQISVHEGKLVRSNAKLQRWNDDIGRLNRGENVRVDLLIKTEQEQLNIIYDRIKDEKAQLKVIADEQVVVQENKLTEYAERTKTDLALLQQRPDGKIDEETGKTEKEIAIDKVRKRDRGVSWVARDKMRKISEQLRKDFDKIGNDYAPQIGTINTRIQELRQQAQLKTEDLDAKIIQLEGFIEKEQDIVDDIREDKLVLEQAYRELEVEVGPVKYIAEFIYGDDAVGMLDNAVRGVILLLIFVFDPLAVLLIIAGNMTIRQHIQLKPLKMRNEKDDDVIVEQEDGADLVIPADIKSSAPKPVEDVTEQKEEKRIPKGTAVRSHEEGIAGIIHSKTEPEELDQNIKEILEQANPEVREEVAKELEKDVKEESVSVLVDKTNKTILEPLVNKGRSLLKSLASGKSKKVSWIDTPHEPKH
jgi:hypothetical protein|tara:strand:+ start:1880 stop:3445 length:1566 start_codon:yes stop_codon:yes gene_type:complete